MLTQLLWKGSGSAPPRSPPLSSCTTGSWDQNGRLDGCLVQEQRRFRVLLPHWLGLKGVITIGADDLDRGQPERLSPRDYFLPEVPTHHKFLSKPTHLGHGTLLSAA